MMMLLISIVAGHAQSRLMMTIVATTPPLSAFIPRQELVQGRDGFLYGALYGGGVFGKGTVFKTSLDGAITYVSFDGTNGADPYKAPIQMADGNLYGIAGGGGSMDGGTVYRIDTNGTLRAIYSFDLTNGSAPQDLVLGRDGDFYGVTAVGGIGSDGTTYTGNGVVFKVTTNGVFTRLASFGETNHYPARIVQADDGLFYGLTSAGGDYSKGTIFRMNPEGTLTTIVTFNGTNGSDPRSLILASDGALYGVTSSGGNSSGDGTIFTVTTNGEFTTLWQFSFLTDGASPICRLLEVSNGVFYGTTYWGRDNLNGGVFQFTSDGQFTNLFQFDEFGGRTSSPWAGLIKGSDGNFYGAAQRPDAIFCLRPVEAPVFQSSVQSNQFNMKWNAWAGSSYELQYKTNLNEPSWHPLVDLDAATNGVLSHSEPIGSDMQRFYRVGLGLSKQ